MIASFRLFSPHDAGSFVGVDCRKALRLTTSVMPSCSNFGGVSLNFGSKTLHHFFSQVGKTDPHTRLSSLVLRRKETMEEKRLTMDQKTFAKRANAIKPADLVAEAAEWAALLTNEAEAKTGKTDTALETVARQTGVNQSTLWRLRYRKPKDLAVSVYMKLKTAWEAVQQRQFERMQHELEVACLRGESPDDVLLQRIAAALEAHPANPNSKINNGAAGD